MAQSYYKLPTPLQVVSLISYLVTCTRSTKVVVTRNVKGNIPSRIIRSALCSKLLRNGRLIGQSVPKLLQLPSI